MERKGKNIYKIVQIFVHLNIIRAQLKTNLARAEGATESVCDRFNQHLRMQFVDLILCE